MLVSSQNLLTHGLKQTEPILFDGCLSGSMLVSLLYSFI